MADHSAKFDLTWNETKEDIDLATATNIAPFLATIGPLLPKSSPQRICLFSFALEWELRRYSENEREKVMQFVLNRRNHENARQLYKETKHIPPYLKVIKGD